RCGLRAVVIRGARGLSGMRHGHGAGRTGAEDCRGDRHLDDIALASDHFWLPLGKCAVSRVSFRTIRRPAASGGWMTRAPARRSDRIIRGACLECKKSHTYSGAHTYAKLRV